MVYDVRMETERRPSAPITVAIPTHPARGTIRTGLLGEAVQSVYSQIFRPDGGIALAMDVNHEGAWVTRQKALDRVETEWVAFLDSDDVLLPNHLDLCYTAAMYYNADFVYPYFYTHGMRDPFATPENPLGHFGREMDMADPHHTTMTVLVRTELAKSVGFTPPAPGDQVGGEDWRFILGCVKAGAKFKHVAERTWIYRNHGRNSSGRPDVGDARV